MSTNTQLVCCPKRPNIKTANKQWKVFLAGPIQGAPKWQHEIEAPLKNVIFYSPRRRSYKDFDYDEQVLWD